MAEKTSRGRGENPKAQIIPARRVGSRENPVPKNATAGRKSSPGRKA